MLRMTRVCKIIYTCSYGLPVRWRFHCSKLTSVYKQKTLSSSLITQNCDFWIVPRPNSVSGNETNATYVCVRKTVSAIYSSNSWGPCQLPPPMSTPTICYVEVRIVHGHLTSSCNNEPQMYCIIRAALDSSPGYSSL